MSAPAGLAETLRQQEREHLLRERNERVPDVHLPRPAAAEGADRIPVDETPCVTLDRIVLIGDAADRFQWALAAANQTESGVRDVATSACVGTRGISLIIRRMQGAIVRQGYVTTRVLAGPQADLQQGLLTLTLLPGRIRSIRIEPGSDSRATLWNAVPARPGDLLNLRDIEQAMENFRRVPTAEADISIAVAEMAKVADGADGADGTNGTDGSNMQPGQTDLLIRWKQRIPFRLSLSADDSGSRSTGKYLGSATISWDHWLALNDLLYVSFNHDLGGGDSGARGTQGYVAHYALPLGYSLLGLTVSRNRYHQSVAGLNQTYLYAGESENSAIRLSRVVYRDAMRKTTLSVGGWARTSANYIDDTEMQVQRRRMAGWDAGVSHREFIGAATLDFNLNYRRGTGAMSALPAPEETFDEGTSRPRIVLADAWLNVPIALGRQRLRYTGTWRAQWNRTPLVPQDRFAIGGRHTVRGYDGENQLLADRGWLLRNDFGFALGQSGQELYLGLDIGQVGGPASHLLAGTTLSGAVVGLRGPVKGIYYDVFAGRPLRKPDGFGSAAIVAGFNLNLSF